MEEATSPARREAVKGWMGAPCAESGEAARSAGRVLATSDRGKPVGRGRRMLIGRRAESAQLATPRDPIADCSLEPVRGLAPERTNRYRCAGSGSTPPPKRAFAGVRWSTPKPWCALYLLGGGGVTCRRINVPERRFSWSMTRWSAARQGRSLIVLRHCQPSFPVDSDDE